MECLLARITEIVSPMEKLAPEFSKKQVRSTSKTLFQIFITNLPCLDSLSALLSVKMDARRLENRRSNVNKALARCTVSDNANNLKGQLDYCQQIKCLVHEVKEALK